MMLWRLVNDVDDDDVYNNIVDDISNNDVITDGDIFKWERDNTCILDTYIHHMHLNAWLYL